MKTARLEVGRCRSRKRSAVPGNILSVIENPPFTDH